MNLSALDQRPGSRGFEQDVLGSFGRSAYRLAVVLAFIAGLIIGQHGAWAPAPDSPHPLPRPRQLFP